jgi:hypothetical protein
MKYLLPVTLLLAFCITSHIHAAETTVAFINTDEVSNKTEMLSLQIALADESVRAQLLKIRQEKKALVAQISAANEEEDVNEIGRKNMLLNKKESFLMQGFNRRNDHDQRKMLFAYAKLKYPNIPVIVLTNNNSENPQMVLSKDVKKVDLTNEVIEALIAELN